MGTTNNGLHYPEAGDLVRNFPAVQRASQKAIDARISELDEGLQPVRAATDAREGGTLVKRRSDGGSNHQSLWVAEVPKNTGSVTHKGYVDDADAATLAAAKADATTKANAAESRAKAHADQQFDSVRTRSTGMRWINSLFPEAVGGGVRLQRLGDLVELTITDLTLTENNRPGNSNNRAELPPGFRPSAPQAINTVPMWGHAAPSTPVLVRESGPIQILHTTASSGTLTASLTWVTTDPWPSTYPGDPN